MCCTSRKSYHTRIHFPGTGSFRKITFYTFTMCFLPLVQPVGQKAFSALSVSLRMNLPVKKIQYLQKQSLKFMFFFSKFCLLA